MDLDDILCAICGAAIDPGLDRGFAVGDGRFLCHACCVARGGEWDEALDRWVKPPRVSEVPDERRPHP
jgi:recombinational DNA repair protein (RecF pathway)